MVKGQTMSDWIISMKEKGLRDFATSLHSEKIEDSKRLENSGLPVFRGLRLDYQDFNEQNHSLMNFINSCRKGVVIRALPQTPNLPRRYKIGAQGYCECEQFLRRNVVKDNNYVVYITEWEPQNRAAIIISNPKRVLVEVGKCSLDDLSHGGNFTLSCNIDLTSVGHLENKIIWTKRGDHKDQKVMKKALRTLELTRDSFNPYFKRGYFELVSTISGHVKFVDYKVNEMYLK